jgi:hypothetical protein
VLELGLGPEVVSLELLKVDRVVGDSKHIIAVVMGKLPVMSKTLIHTKLFLEQQLPRDLVLRFDKSVVLISDTSIQ